MTVPFVGWTRPCGGESASPVVREIEARAGRRFHRLRVDVVGGAGVVLHGTTDSYHAKQLAQQVAARVTGLPVLANRIEVTLQPW